MIQIYRNRILTEADLTDSAGCFLLFLDRTRGSGKALVGEVCSATNAVYKLYRIKSLLD